MKKSFSKRQSIFFFGFIEFAFYSMYACFIAYAVAFALSRGYSESIASYAVMTYMLAAFIGQFILGGMCDKRQINKYVFLCGMTLSAILQTAIFFFDSLPLFFILYTCVGFVTQPMGSILDSWMLKAIDYDMINFGRARSMGTVGYAFVMLAFGQLIKVYGYRAAMIGTIICTAFTLLPALIVPNTRTEAPAQKSRSSGSIRDLLQCRQYRSLLVVLFLLGLAVAPFNNLKIMILQNVGGDVGDQGIDSFIGCVAQFLTFCFPQFVSMFSEYGKLVVSASLACIGSIIFFIAKAPFIVFAGTFLILGLYGITNSSTRFIVGKYLDPGLHTKAIGVGDACYNTISAVFAMLYAGNLSELFGVRAVILISILLTAGALVYLRFSALRDRIFRAG